MKKNILFIFINLFMSPIFIKKDDVWLNKEYMQIKGKRCVKYKFILYSLHCLFQIKNQSFLVISNGVILSAKTRLSITRKTHHDLRKKGIEEEKIRKKKLNNIRYSQRNEWNIIYHIKYYIVTYTLVLHNLYNTY